MAASSSIRLLKRLRGLLSRLATLQPSDIPAFLVLLLLSHPAVFIFTFAGANVSQFFLGFKLISSVELLSGVFWCSSFMTRCSILSFTRASAYPLRGTPSTLRPNFLPLFARGFFAFKKPDLEIFTLLGTSSMIEREIP